MAFLDAAAEFLSEGADALAADGGRITHAFSSEAIAFIDWDPATEELSVTFARGGPYVFTGVPRSVVEGWLTAPSAGRYYHAFIKAYA